MEKIHKPGEVKQLFTNAVKLEKKAVIDANSDEKFAKISGLVCHFGTINENREIVTRDSFDKFFKRLDMAGGPNDMPKINVMHGWREEDLIGIWNSLEPREEGLYGEGVILKTQHIVSEILPKIEAGILSHFSTEGYVTEWMEGKDEDGYFYVATNFELTAVAIVDMPADLRANVELQSTNAYTLRRKYAEEQQAKREEENRKLAALAIASALVN